MSTLRKIRNLLATADLQEWDEKQHPRRNDGEFAPKGGGKAAPSTKSVHLVPAHEDRDKWPEHIKALKLPPAWHSVRVSSDPHADLLAIGKDAKNRDQYVYSPKFVHSQSAIKFARITSLDRKFNGIMAKNDAARRVRDQKTKDHADCFHLVATMGLRPGGEDDTGADTRAFGASTLEGRHVVANNRGTHLQFVGKKGVGIDLPVEDKATAKMLRNRAKAAGADGKLFPSVSAASLLDYVHQFGEFKTKDFRTRLGTRLAHDMIRSGPKPHNMKEYKARVREVAKHVAEHLGNTPAVALTSYINPVVWAPWKAKLGEEAFDRTAIASEQGKPGLPNVRFGDKDAKDIDWRKAKLPPDPDDDGLRRPPKSVIKLIGFDPTKGDKK